MPETPSFPPPRTPLALRSRIAVCSLLLPLFALNVTAAPAAPRERTRFTDNWRFTRGDPGWLEPQIDYAALRPWMLATANPMRADAADRIARPSGAPGSDLAYVQPDFDDTGWRQLNLPHDWGIEGPFDPAIPGDVGKLPWAGVGWYRKTFNLPAADAGRRLTLEVDGAMAYSSFWLNGSYVGGWASGYTSFALDLTPYAKPGERNVLAVRLDNPPESSRWYPGSGLYRNVWLTRTGPLHVAHWGTTITTPRVAPSEALVQVATIVANETAQRARVAVTTTLFAVDAAGRPTGDPVATHTLSDVLLAPRRENSVAQSLRVAAPRLWSPDSPARYVAVTEIAAADGVVDRVEERFGLRTIAWTGEAGLQINGQAVPIQGVCQHHDLGALGSAVSDRAIARQVEILKSMGVNAIRTSHNPPAPELLEACDRLGVIVMAEAFDCWRKGKSRQDYHRIFDDWHEADLRAFIRRDRNHPSIFCWSIGNEVIEQWGDDGQEGWKLAAQLAAIVRAEDRTRPLTGGFNGEHSGFNGYQLVLDAMGFNYKPWAYRTFHAAFPAAAIHGSETASCVSSRGEYFFPVSDEITDPASRVNFQVSSYDLFAPPWGTTPDHEWQEQDRTGIPTGEFVWTGFDYLGEPTPYNADATNLLNFSDPAKQAAMAAELAALGRITVPSRSSYFGIVDLAGFPKDRYYLYQSRWRPDLPMAHLLPHWTWPGREGEVTPVHVYTSGDEGELFLNGVSLGRRRKAPGAYRLRWDDVRYAPGELKVVTYRDGQPWAEAVQHTAGAAAALRASADRATLAADGRDLAFLTVDIVDALGVNVPQAKDRVTFNVTGPGDLIATDNGDATSLESFQSPARAAWNGKVLGIVRTQAGQTGAVTVTITAPGLAPDTVVLTATTPE